MSIHYTSEDLKLKFPDGKSLAFARHGEALFREHRTEEALRVLNEGTKLHPGYLTAFLILGRVYRETGRLAEARTELENALRLDSRCPAALSLLADIAESEGNRAECAGHLQALVAQEPWDEEFQSRRRRALSSLPKTRPAPVSVRVDHLADAREEDPGFEEDENGDAGAIPNVATVTLAEIYFQQGLKEQALQIYRQLLARQPANETVIKRLRELEASTT